MNKIKEFFKTKKGKIITSVTLVILVLLFCAIFFKKEPLRFEDYIFATDVSFSEINKDALQGRLADTLASQVMKEKMNFSDYTDASAYFYTYEGGGHKNILLFELNSQTDKGLQTEMTKVVDYVTDLADYDGYVFQSSPSENALDNIYAQILNGETFYKYDFNTDHSFEIYFYKENNKLLGLIIILL